MIKKHLLTLAQELERLPTRWKFTRRDRLENVPAFDLGQWFSDRAHILFGDPGDLIGQGPPECNTAACAVGLAATLPYFQKRGFRLEESIHVYRSDDEVCDSWDAVGQFFDLPYRQAVYLFGEDSYDDIERSDPKIVARRIRDFVRDEDVRG